MFPWMKEQITEAWNSRKSFRGAKKHSNGSSGLSRGMQGSSESFNIRIISLEGVVLNIPVTSEFNVEKVKSIAIENFYGHDKSKKNTQFRLVHGLQLRRLNDEKNLEDEDFSKSDELLLVQVRSLGETENLSEEALKGPTDDEITKVTKDLLLRNPPKPAINSDCPADFQTEIRKILVTLAETSAKILMYSPDAVKFYEIVKEKLEAQLKPPNDPKAIKYLVEMGFSERRALKALRLRKMNTSEALEWLLDHQEDVGEEDDLQLPPLDLLDKDKAGSSSSDKPIMQEPNLVYIVNLLLDNYMQYQKMDFKVDPRLVESLEDMGFEKQKILETLKVTGNNHENACAWLLGERRPSLHNLYKGMDPDGPIYDAIMNNPQIQLSLTHPKMLLAYLSMLETPLSTSVWMKDPQVSPVLSQIFKTYHGEKHAIHVNRYNNS